MHLLPCGGDGGKKIDGAGGFPASDRLETGGGRNASGDPHLGGQLRLLDRRSHADCGVQLSIAAPQEFHDPRIEALAGLGHYVLHGFIQRQRAAVLAVRGEGVQAIDGSQNPGAQGDFVALQPGRIPCSVPFFMMRAHDRRYRVRELYALQNLRPHHRVNLHLLEFLRRQAAGFGDDVLRHGQFANVMQQGGRP